MASPAGFPLPATAAPNEVAPQIAAPDLSCEACKIILLDPASAERDPVDAQIAQTQNRIKTDRNPGPQVERLGWLFVEKARVSNDPGFYKLAEECARCLESANSNSPDAILLRGHVLHSLHHFKEAEPLALELVKKRGLAFDFGLLGDIEYDQGKIPEAVAAYQRMVDLRPDLQAYSRVAQVRWITGDLTGAIEAMTTAAEAGSPLNAEPTAWTLSRLALLKLQSGDFSGARQSALAALQMQTNSAPALFALGRVQLATGDTNAAVDSLKQAASLNHLPEAQWILADALRATGDNDQAAVVEKELQNRGAAEDPRSYSLYLSTRGIEPELALRLAKKELDTRADIFTHDALAWALNANHQVAQAQDEMKKALAEGTEDARLFFHAAIISAAAGNKDESARCSRLALKYKQMLFPSELEQLRRIARSDQLSQQNVPGISPN
ncbi:MAG TPA: tetratricopeptide repeat protein [Verrucomicrobiae bacterium]